jgi:hypothetical protein
MCAPAAPRTMQRYALAALAAALALSAGGSSASRTGPVLSQPAGLQLREPAGMEPLRKSYVRDAEERRCGVDVAGLAYRDEPVGGRPELGQ